MAQPSRVERLRSLVRGLSDEALERVERAIASRRAPAAPAELAMQRPGEVPEVPMAQRVSAEPIWDRFVDHPGRGLTPKKLLEYYDAADEGDPLDMLDAFDDRIEADAHLRGLLEARVDSVARKPWTLQEGGDSPADRKAAQMLEERLRLVPNFIETMEHQLRFNWYGWSATEVQWERQEGLTVPAWFTNVVHRRFRFSLERDELLLLTSENMLGEPLLPGRWWITARSGRLMSAAGLMRTAAWWSMFKSYSLRDWLVWSNRFGIPSVHGIYDENATPEDRTNLKKAVKALGRDGWAVFERGCEIVITSPTTGGKADDVHGALVKLCDEQVSKLVAGATLLTETTGQASYAIGQVHAARGFDLLAGDASRLAESFELAVGLPFVRYNGLDARPPRLKIHIVQDQSPVTRAQIFSIARNELQMPLDEDQVRQELQLKAPQGATIQPPPEVRNVPGGTVGGGK